MHNRVYNYSRSAETATEILYLILEAAVEAKESKVQ